MPTKPLRINYFWNGSRQGWHKGVTRLCTVGYHGSPKKLQVCHREVVEENAIELQSLFDHRYSFIPLLRDAFDSRSGLLCIRSCILDSALSLLSVCRQPSRSQFY